jgi:hypothetical protein
VTPQGSGNPEPPGLPARDNGHLVVVELEGRQLPESEPGAEPGDVEIVQPRVRAGDGQEFPGLLMGKGLDLVLILPGVDELAQFAAELCIDGMAAEQATGHGALEDDAEQAVAPARRRWRKAIAAEPAANGLALEDVPYFLRGSCLLGIRTGVAPRRTSTASSASA